MKFRLPCSKVSNLLFSRLNLSVTVHLATGITGIISALSQLTSVLTNLAYISIYESLTVASRASGGTAVNYDSFYYPPTCDPETDLSTSSWRMSEFLKCIPRRLTRGAVRKDAQKSFRPLWYKKDVTYSWNIETMGRSRAVQTKQWTNNEAVPHVIFNCCVSKWQHQSEDVSLC